MHLYNSSRLFNMNLVRILPSYLRPPKNTAICSTLNLVATRTFAYKPHHEYVYVPTYLKRYHEPEYLDYLKPRIPYYELINCQVKGYDPAILEEYVRAIQKIAKVLKIPVVNYWATPCVSTKFDTLVPDKDLVETSYKVNVYERNVQFEHLTSKSAALLLQAVQSAKPVGTWFSLHRHTPEHDEIRYIPDLQLANLEKELEEWSQPLSVLEKTKKM